MLGRSRQNTSSIEKDIFQKGSTTYYWSSKFFPAAVRDDVFKLYSFVRVADDYVDQLPPQAAKFHALRKAWDQAKTDMRVFEVSVYLSSL